jgi:hypothetical protein
MLSTLRSIRSPTKRVATQLRRTAATQAQKRSGDISDAFVSLSGQQFVPLTPEYADLKGRLIRGRESEVRESWERLLQDLRKEIPLIVELGSKIIPEIDFKDIDNAPETFSNELRKRGVAVVRGVVPEEEALQWKQDLREYIKQNPQTKGKMSTIHMVLSIADNHQAFPADNPQVFELYWNPTSCSWQPEPAKNSPLSYVLLAQLKSACALIDTASH